MDDLLSQVAAQFEEDVANEKPKKEDIRDKEKIEERFKETEEKIVKRKEMLELSKTEDNESSRFFKDKNSRKNDKDDKKDEKNDDKKKSSNDYYSRNYYPGGSSSKKDSEVKNEKAAEYADNVVDALKSKMDKEFGGGLPDDWDIFDIHSEANKKHNIIKEVKKSGEIPFRVKAKLAMLKGCVYVGHSTLETLYVLKHE